MSESTYEMLRRNMENVTETLVEIMTAIREDLPYFDEQPTIPEGTQWDDEGDLVDADGKIHLDVDGNSLSIWDMPYARDPQEYLSEYPLEVIDERGRNFTVVLCTGGPHIEIEAEGGGRASLEGYWAGTRVSLNNEIYDEVLDYFIDRDD